MSTEKQEMEMSGTKPVQEHQWLQQLVGTWNVESEMVMPDGTTATSKGMEVTTDFGGLWAYGEGKSEMPDGSPMNYKVALGYDLTFKEYRGFMVMNVSSHLWKYVGTLSEDGNTMTLDCEGPDMMGENLTAHYRDIITIIDKDHRTMTSTGQGPDGQWVTFMTAHYTRA
jgi:hypothetical protein